MANEAAMALENAKLYEDARELADQDQLTGSTTTATCTSASARRSSGRSGRGRR